MNFKMKAAIGLPLVASLAIFISCGDNPDFVEALEDDPGSYNFDGQNLDGTNPPVNEGDDSADFNQGTDSLNSGNQNIDTQSASSQNPSENQSSTDNLPLSNPAELNSSSATALSSSQTGDQPQSSQSSVVYEDVKTFEKDGKKYYITEDNEVKNEEGTTIGQYSPDKKAIVDTQGNVIAENVDKSTLPAGKIEVKTSSSSTETTSSNSVAQSSSDETVSSSDIAPSSSNASLQVTYEGELEQTLMKGEKFSPIVFKNVEKDPGSTGGRPNTMYYLTGQYDATQKTYTLSGTVPTYDLSSGQDTETITFGDQKFVIKVNISATQKIPVTYTGGALEQDVVKGGAITPIVFNNVQVDPKDNNGRSNTAYYLNFVYDSKKLTYTVSGKIPDNYDLQDAAKTETLTLGGEKFVIKINVVNKVESSSSSVAPSSSSAKPSSSSVAPSSSSVKPSSSSVAQSSSSVKPSSSSVAPSSSSVKPSSSSVAPSSSSAKPSSSSVAPSSSSVKPSSSSVAPSSSSVKSSSSQAQPENTCYDKASGKYVELYTALLGPNSEQYAYQANCAFTCYYDPTGNDCKLVESGTIVSSSSSSVALSSSSAKSSSSSAAQSSSSAKSSSSYSGGETPNFKIKEGGRSGQGWGSRYWDCCMPHCAWNGNTSNPTKTCNSNMDVIGESGGSACGGGSGGVCDFQAPWAASENLAYAFAAVPSGLGGECGKCFLLTFDGGSHGNSARTGALNGKQMVIMVSNIGGDVGSNQFDIMIPGGGVGLFNGCGVQLGISSTGAQYGGFISDCSSNSDPVACVKEKCSIFSKYPKIQAGCEFSATWYNAADNPTFHFDELESCPNEISSKW
ncbi:MAG: hypothetical protein MJY47_07380 [Fibrobacter sp.]|nr:hypothetical protein [Fibrobacter sp.]